MSILFIVNSACLFINESLMVEEIERGKPKLRKLVSRVKAFRWNVLNFSSLLCLLWLGVLLSDVLSIMFTVIDSRVLYWVSLTTGSIGICTLLYFLQQKWIPLLVKLFVQTLNKHQLDQASLSSSTQVASRVVSFDLGEKIAREIMTPRLDMICLERNKSIVENVNIAIKYMRTRYPVVKEDKDDIIGFVHIKDLLGRHENIDQELQWDKWVRQIITVPDCIPISNLLAMMQKKKTQIALLIDEYGGTSGMATLEDILEEIVGDIQDEFDSENHTIMCIQPDYYQISAMLLIEEVNSYFNISLEDVDMDSIGGYMYSNIMFPPHIGQSVTFEDVERDTTYQFTIEKMEQLRITVIGVRKLMHVRSYKKSVANE